MMNYKKILSSSKQNLFGVPGVDDHGFAGGFRVLLLDGAEDFVVLVVAVFDLQQILVEPFDAGRIDLLQGLEDRQEDRVVGCLGNGRVEGLVVFVQLDGILVGDALADILQQIAQHRQLKFRPYRRGQIGCSTLDILPGGVDGFHVDLVEVDELKQRLHKQPQIHRLDEGSPSLADIHKSHHIQFFQSLTNRNAADGKQFAQRGLRRQLIARLIGAGDNTLLQLLHHVVAFGHLVFSGQIIQWETVLYEHII